jgi:hypothetical protein
MNKNGLLFLVVLLNFNWMFSQTRIEIDALLNAIATVENSKEVIKSAAAQKIKTYGEQSLLLLSSFFTDTTLTKTYSECNDRYLVKGEIAMIVADGIEKMPYFKVTRIQNCTLTFCKDNPNLIEYYFSTNKYLSNNKFHERYVQWLYSKNRIKRVKGKARRERKRIIKEWQSINEKWAKIEN